MSLKQNEKEAILKEMTYFDYYLSLDTGVVTTKLDDGRFIDEDGNYYTYEEVVRCQFNDSVKKRFAKYVGILLAQRGLPDLNELTEGDVHVAAVLKKKKKNKPTAQDVQGAINLVKTVYGPQFLAAILQLTLWAIVREDLFSMEKRGINCRIEVAVNPKYWEDTDDDEDEMDRLIMADLPNAPKREQSNPLEAMIAIVTQLMEDHPKFAKTAGELASVVIANLSFANDNDIDDAGYFRQQLGKSLPSIMEQQGQSGIVTFTSGGLRLHDEKVGQDPKDETNIIEFGSG